MLLKTSLNSIENHKSFVYDCVRWDADAARPNLLIQVLPKKGSKGFCSSCGKRSSTYDTMKPWRFQFVPLWGLVVFLVYSMKRLDCKNCGVKVEMIPWADGKKGMHHHFL